MDMLIMPTVALSVRAICVQAHIGSAKYDF